MHPEHTARVEPSQSTHVAAPSDYQDPPLDGPDVLQQMSRRRLLERAHPKHPIPAFDCRSGPPKQAWFLPGAKRARESDASLDILRAAEWVAARRGMAWGSNDQTANDALRSRCFDYGYIERRRIETRPTWLETLCRDQWICEDGPGFPAKEGFIRFVTDLLHARRVGAIGAILSQADAGTLYGVTPRHWRRWMNHAEAMGMVRILQLWQRDPTRRRHRGHWRMCYMLGHSVVERAGIALYEGLDRTFASGKPMKPAAAAAAKRLRAKRKDANRARHNELWHEGCSSDVREARDGPSSLSPDMVSGPTLRSRVTGDSAPVSPKREFINARDTGAIVNSSRSVHGGGREIQQAGAFLASLARLNDTPTANPVEPEQDTVRGSESPRLGRGVDASTTKTPSYGSIGAMLAEYTEKLRLSLTAFLFFFVSTMVGCREIPDESFGAGLGTTEITGTTVDAGLMGSGSVGTSPGLGDGSQDGSLDSAETTHGSDIVPSVEDEFSEIPDGTWDPETSSETGSVELWEDILLRDDCVFDCVSSNNTSSLWCDSQTWNDHAVDYSFCVYLSRDALLFRCGEICDCAVGCE